MLRLRMEPAPLFFAAALIAMTTTLEADTEEPPRLIRADPRDRIPASTSSC